MVLLSGECVRRGIEGRVVGARRVLRTGVRLSGLGTVSFAKGGRVLGWDMEL